MPKKFILELSDEKIAQLGGCNNKAEFEAALDNLITAANAPKTEQKVVLLEDVQKIVGTMTGNISQLSEKLQLVETAVISINPENIRQIAKTEGSAAAQAALGAVGANGGAVVPPSPAAPAAVAKDYVAIVRENIAAGMSKSDAITAAIKSNPKEYTEARAKGIPTF
jgi:hypothetical protein